MRGRAPFILGGREVARGAEDHRIVGDKSGRRGRGTHDFFGPEDGELQVVDPLAGHRGSRAEARLVLHGESRLPRSEEVVVVG